MRIEELADNFQYRYGEVAHERAAPAKGGGGGFGKSVAPEVVSKILKPFFSGGPGPLESEEAGVVG